MSANRALAASQRRRVLAGNTQQETVKPGPTQSINSAQAFSTQQQATGRLAGQHAAYNQQQNMKQQHKKSSSQTKPLTQGDINKITVSQAILLITLRLGKLEAIISQMDVDNIMNELSTSESDMDGTHDMVMVDKNVIKNIVERLDGLETKEKCNDEPPQSELINKVAHLTTVVTKTTGAVAQLNKNSATSSATLKKLSTELSNIKNDITSMNDTIGRHDTEIINISLGTAGEGAEGAEEAEGAAEENAYDYMADDIAQEESLTLSVEETNNASGYVSETDTVFSSIIEPLDVTQENAM